MLKMNWNFAHSVTDQDANSRRALWAFALAVLLAVLGMPQQLAAQIGGNGTIGGVVMDSTGAIIPGATVEATQVATGVKTVRQTTEVGYYVIASMPPGEYTVKVSAAGFATLVQQHVMVDALGTTTVNASLNVGATTSEVVVTATPPALDVADASMSQTVRNELYTALPLTMSNAPRNPVSFVQYMPGSSSYGASTNTSGASYGVPGNTIGNVNGGTGWSTEVYIDGLPLTTAVLQGETRYLAIGTSIEAVDQFQMQSAGNSVQFSGQGSSNYVIKSGTNKFHGLAYESNLSSALTASGYFATSKPVSRQNEFGAAIGGPIKRNKLFFFGAYTGYRATRDTSPTLVTIPTLLMRSANFSELPVAIYDPSSTSCNASGCTRMQFSGNVIPGWQQSTASTFLESFLPAPTYSGISNNYLSVQPIGTSVNNTTEKIDYNINDSHRISGYFTMGKSSPTTLYANGALPLPYTPTRMVTQNLSSGQVKEAWTVSPQMLNEFTIGYARFNVPITDATMLSNCGSAGGGELASVGQYCNKWMSAAGVSGLPTGEASQSFPYMSFSGSNAPYSWRNGNSQAYNERQNNETIQDNVQYTRGRHSLVVGAQIQWLEANETPQTYQTASTWSFSNAETAGFAANSSTPLSSNGNSYASYLLGAVDSASVTDQAYTDYGARFRNFSWWLQDNLKATRRLTLNLGLRHDLETPWVEVNNRMSWMNPTMPNPAINGYAGALIFAGYGADSCQCRSILSTYPRNLQPRLGLVYSMNPKTAVRVGYAINSIRDGATGGKSNKEGTGVLGYSANPTVSTLNSGVTPAFYWQNGFPSYQAAPFFDPTLNTGFYANSSGATVQAGSVSVIDTKTAARPPYYINWNVSLERQLTTGLTLEVAYVASEGHYLNGGSQTTPATMTFGTLSNQMDPKYLALGSLLNKSATAANIAAAKAVIPGIALPYASYSGTISQMLRPFPQYSTVTDVWGDIGNSNYQSLQVVVHEAQYHGLIAMGNMTWSKELDDMNTYSAYVKNKAQSTSPALTVNAMLLYSLPFGKGRDFLANSGRVVTSIVSGWQLTGITTWLSGMGLGPVTASCTLPNAGQCFASYTAGFSGQVKLASYGSGNPRTATYLNSAAFQNPAAYAYGNSPRTMPYGLRGPLYFNQNMSLSREISLYEGLKLTLRADSTNTFNNVSFSAPSVTFSSTSFGKISSQSNSPRNLQFAARLTF
jgi:hypothetical protein